MRGAGGQLLDLPGSPSTDRPPPELDEGGRLVAGEPLLAEGDDLRLGSGGALGEHHQRRDRLTRLLVGDPDDGDLGHRPATSRSGRSLARPGTPQRLAEAGVPMPLPMRPAWTAPRCS